MPKSIRNYLVGIRSAFNLFPAERDLRASRHICNRDGFTEDMENLRNDFNRAISSLGIDDPYEQPPNKR